MRHRTLGCWGLLCLLTAWPGRLGAQAVLEDIVAEVRRAEASYRDLEVAWDFRYRFVGRPPAAEPDTIVAEDESGRTVLQGRLLYYSVKGEFKTAGGTTKVTDAVETYDGDKSYLFRGWGPGIGNSGNEKGPRTNAVIDPRPFFSVHDLGPKMGYAPEIARQSAWQFMKTGDPRVSMLRRFAGALGISVEDLISVGRRKR